MHNYIYRPGAYELDVERNRNVQMLHSFGGRAKMHNAVEIKCVINSEDQVFSFINIISIIYVQAE
jgi:hypothetical protein